MKGIFCASSRTTTVLKWRSAMNEIRDMNEAMFKWFIEKPTSQ